MDVVIGLSPINNDQTDCPFKGCGILSKKIRSTKWYGQRLRRGEGEDYKVKDAIIFACKYGNVHTCLITGRTWKICLHEYMQICLHACKPIYTWMDGKLHSSWQAGLGGGGTVGITSADPLPNKISCLIPSKIQSMNQGARVGLKKKTISKKSLGTVL
jgi:hypothetical protein